MFKGEARALHQCEYGIGEVCSFLSFTSRLSLVEGM
jgi:hypothetical protein